MHYCANQTNMSWLLKHRKKDNKWRIWTTISDGWLTDWLSENEIKEYLTWRDGFDSKLKAIETYMTFPAGWHDKDSHKGFDYLEGASKTPFYEWQLEALKLGEGGYEAEVEKKYKEIVQQQK